MKTSPVLSILSTLSFICAVFGAKNGIVGFGIPLYEDLCCQSCHDSLSALYLNCTTFDDGMDMHMAMDGMDMPMGMTSDECRASNLPWLRTMAYCIQQNCNADGYPSEKQAECFSNQAVAGASEPTFQNSLPAQAPTVELASDAMWLNDTSLVNGDLYYSTHGTLGEFGRSEYLHTRYSLVLYVIVIGICIVCGVLAHISTVFPVVWKRLRGSTIGARFQQYFVLPPLFGSRRLEPLPGRIGYVPSRALSSFIIIYVILNIVFSSVSFGSFQPNIYFMSSGFELCEYVGNRTGTLSLVNISIAILFAGRNNLLIAVTGWSQTSFLILHRWTARVATVQAVVHSIVYTLAYFEPMYDGASAYAAAAAQPFYYWGIIGTILLCLATGLAFLPLRIKFYESFLILHIVLVVVALVACWYHLVPHFGYDYGYQVWLYIAFAFWGADRLTRVVRIAFYNRLNGTAMVEEIPNSNIMQITLFPRSTMGFGPGQHSFLYFPMLGKFWENHPFSVAGWGKEPISSTDTLNATSHDKEIPDSTEAAVSHKNRGKDRAYIRLLIRAHSGATATLQRRLRSKAGSTLTTSIYTEGPYAGHRTTLQPLLAADTVLCLVGGIGITNALGFIQQYKRSKISAGEFSTRHRGLMTNAKRCILVWSAREASLIEHVKRNFLADAEGFECSFWCTGAPRAPRATSQDSQSPDRHKTSELTTTTAVTGLVEGRMDIGAVIRSYLEADHQMTVLVCGPAQMADEATKRVTECVRDGFKVNLVEEAFTW